MPIKELMIHDLPFGEYTQRQSEEIMPGKILERALEARPSGNFHYNGHRWVPQPYPGFAIISMVDTNPGNELLPFQLSALQEELRGSLYPANAYYILPPASFHQTVANTLSGERFRKNIRNRGLEADYPRLVEKAFAAMPAPASATPVRMQLIGLSIFGTSLGLLGVFEKESDYDRLIRFRSQFYEDSGLSGLDIRMTRSFIGHITLAYIEQELDKMQREHLAAVVNAMNEAIARKKYNFFLSNTGLRRYEHLAEFRKESSYPEYLL